MEVTLTRAYCGWLGLHVCNAVANGSQDSMSAAGLEGDCDLLLAARA